MELWLAYLLGRLYRGRNFQQFHLQGGAYQVLPHEPGLTKMVNEVIEGGSDDRSLLYWGRGPREGEKDNRECERGLLSDPT